MGDTISGLLNWPVAFVTLVAVLTVFVLVLRAQSRRQGVVQRTGRASSERHARLSVLETLQVDDQRRLMIVECDGEQHLLLLGSRADVVVKRDLTPPVREEVHHALDEQEAPAETQDSDQTSAYPVAEPASIEVPRPAPLTSPRPIAATEPLAVERRTQIEPRIQLEPRVASEPRVNEPRVTNEPKIANEPLPVAAPVVTPRPTATHTPPEFSEMTRKLEEALKRTAGNRAAPLAPRPVEPKMADAPSAASPSQPAEPRLGDLGRLEPRFTASLPESMLRQPGVERTAPPFTTSDFTKVSVSDEPLLEPAPRVTERASSVQDETHERSVEEESAATLADAAPESAQYASAMPVSTAPDVTKPVAASFSAMMASTNALATPATVENENSALPVEHEAEPAGSAPVAGEPKPDVALDPFEEEIRRLLGRDRGVKN